MAVALDADQEALTYFSFPIEKQEDTDSINPVDGTPDIWIWGKATDGTVDADRQIVDPEWSAVALKEWLATGGNVRMAHDPRKPVGKGHDVQCTMDGHYVKSLICDPLAKHFVRTKILNDYSVGISLPDIRFGPNKSLDPYGKATGGIITGRPDGLSKIAELSVCDRGSNFGSRFQMVRKSAGGDAEFIGRMVGDQEEIAKAAPPELLAKISGTALLTKSAPVASAADDLVSVDLPATMSLSVSPLDLAKMNTLSRQHAVRGHYDDLAVKAVTDAEAAVYKRDIDTATRRRLASEGHALPDGSYPIESAGDLHNAAILARSGHGDVAGAKRLIAREARERGVTNPLDDDGNAKKGAGEEGSAPAAEPAAEKSGGALDDKALAALKALQDLMLAAPVPVDEPVVKADAPAGTEAATPDVTKEPDAAAQPVKKAKGKPKGPKKMPPWLNKPKDGDDDSDSDDGKDDDASKACKSFMDHTWVQYWVQGTDGPQTSDIQCKKCHTTPAQAAGVTASPMDPAPVGELQESNPPSSVKGATPQSAGGVKDAPAMQPVPAHREPDGAEVESFEKDSGMSDGDSEGPGRLEAPTLKASPEVLALLRFKSIGIDPELGRLHDLTCPAYHPDEVAKYHPFAELGSLIDEAHWQRKALDAACGPLEHAIAMQELTASALALKAAPDADVNDWRLAAHKAFRDANPGPGTYPTPGSVSPQKYNRPLITDGRSATSTGHAGPNTSPQVATMAPNAHSFDRPPLASAHASPSPSFMKWDSGQYPSQQGMPTQLNYAHLEKDKQRMALVQMHDHLSRQFPEVCPLDTVDLSGTASRPLRGTQPENHPVPATAGIGKGQEAADALKAAAATGKAVPYATGIALPPATKAAAPVAASFKAEPEQAADFFADADVYKGFKKMRKKLGKKVLSGSMTVDEARAKMGRQFAQKGSGEDKNTAQKGADLSPAMKAAAVEAQAGIERRAQALHPVATVFDPDLIKAAVRDALRAESVPLEPATISVFDPSPAIEAAVTKAVTPLLEKIQAQDTKLAETQRVIDAIADQPDPSTASFSGLAFQPVRKTARPAGVTDIAEAAARARRATERELENLYESASDPFAREGFYSALNKVRGGGA